MEDNKLFSEFPPVSTEKWEEVINKDLKGADYEKKLVWRTIEGFNVKPYYRAEDLEGLEYLNANPGQTPYVRGKQEASNVWDVRQDIFSLDAAEAGRVAADAVKRGATSVGFDARSVRSAADMAALLAGIDPQQVKLNFFNADDPVALLGLLADCCRERGCDMGRVQGSLGYDAFAHAMLHGAYRQSEQADLEVAKTLVQKAAELLPAYRVLSVGGALMSNAGAGVVQELGFSLAAASELIARLQEMGCEAGSVAQSIVIDFGVGSTYFMEIAKIRAARMLWAKMAEQYAPKCEAAARCFINVTTSRWNQTVFDPYVNMLRTTTETMSAAVAGADSISVLPFDGAYKDADDFGYHIARNQQLLLKEESYLDKIVDPSAGSYYIENLTDHIAQGAWALFVQVEEKGGFAAALREGFVQEQVEATARKRDTDIATRRTTIVGTNQYPNLLERMGDKVDASAQPEPSSPTDIRPLRPYRGATPFEALRLQTERSGKRPRIFLLTYGNLAMRKARAGFATNFFGVAGYEIVDNPGFASAAEGAKAALEAKADVVVLCSSDDEYADIAQEACNLLKGKVKSLVLAGYPKEMVDTYRSYGIDEFIHVKTNVLESLTAFQKILLA